MCSSVSNACPNGSPKLDQYNENALVSVYDILNELKFSNSSATKYILGIEESPSGEKLGVQVTLSVPHTMPSGAAEYFKKFLQAISAETPDFESASGIHNAEVGELNTSIGSVTSVSSSVNGNENYTAVNSKCSNNAVSCCFNNNNTSNNSKDNIKDINGSNGNNICNYGGNGNGISLNYKYVGNDQNENQIAVRPRSESINSMPLSDILPFVSSSNNNINSDYNGSSYSNNGIIHQSSQCNPGAMSRYGNMISLIGYDPEPFSGSRHSNHNQQKNLGQLLTEANLLASESPQNESERKMLKEDSFAIFCGTPVSDVSIHSFNYSTSNQLNATLSQSQSLSTQKNLSLDGAAPSLMALNPFIGSRNLANAAGNFGGNNNNNNNNNNVEFNELSSLKKNQSLGTPMHSSSNQSINNVKGGGRLNVNEESLSGGGFYCDSSSFENSTCNTSGCKHSQQQSGGIHSTDQFYTAHQQNLQSMYKNRQSQMIQYPTIDSTYQSNKPLDQLQNRQKINYGATQSSSPKNLDVEESSSSSPPQPQRVGGLLQVNPGIMTDNFVCDYNSTNPQGIGQSGSSINSQLYFSGGNLNLLNTNKSKSNCVNDNCNNNDDNGSDNNDGNCNNKSMAISQATTFYCQQQNQSSSTTDNFSSGISGIDNQRFRKGGYIQQNTAQRYYSQQNVAGPVPITQMTLYSQGPVCGYNIISDYNPLYSGGSQITLEKSLCGTNNGSFSGTSSNSSINIAQKQQPDLQNQDIKEIFPKFQRKPITRLVNDFVAKLNTEIIRIKETATTVTYNNPIYCVYLASITKAISELSSSILSVPDSFPNCVREPLIPMIADECTKVMNFYDQYINTFCYVATLAIPRDLKISVKPTFLYGEKKTNLNLISGVRIFSVLYKCCIKPEDTLKTLSLFLKKTTDYWTLWNSKGSKAPLNDQTMEENQTMLVLLGHINEIMSG